MQKKIALIVGTGPNISYSFAKELTKAGYDVALAARNIEKLKALCEPIQAHAFQVDVSSIEDIQKLFFSVENALGEPEVVLFNPSARVKGAIDALDAKEVAHAVNTTAMGAFATAQEAAKRMIPKKHGAIFFTGATASVKGFANSSGFAMMRISLNVTGDFKKA